MKTITFFYLVQPSPESWQKISMLEQVGNLPDSNIEAIQFTQFFVSQSQVFRSSTNCHSCYITSDRSPNYICLIQFPAIASHTVRDGMLAIWNVTSASVALGIGAIGTSSILMLLMGTGTLALGLGSQKNMQPAPHNQHTGIRPIGCRTLMKLFASVDRCFENKSRLIGLGEIELASRVTLFLPLQPA